MAHLQFSKSKVILSLLPSSSMFANMFGRLLVQKTAAGQIMKVHFESVSQNWEKYYLIYKLRVYNEVRELSCALIFKFYGSRFLFVKNNMLPITYCKGFLSSSMKLRHSPVVCLLHNGTLK